MRVIAAAGLALALLLLTVGGANGKPAPHGTPAPHATPKPKPSPKPKPTASPTATPTPTVAPTPTATPTPSPTATPSPPPTGWAVIINDQFDTLPSHWHSYNGPYGSGPHNCAIPGQATVHDGTLDMLFSYLPTGICGPGWYSAGLSLSGFSSVDARVSVRFRVVDDLVAAHRIIPMRWPDDDSSWPAGGEEDFCEGSSITGCTTFLHYATGQMAHDYVLDLTQWHTLTFERKGLHVQASIDGVVAWDYTGTAATLPATMKHVVLQQECRSSCPVGTTGSEHILVDWLTVEVPA